MLIRDSSKDFHKIYWKTLTFHDTFGILTSILPAAAPLGELNMAVLLFFKDYNLYSFTTNTIVNEAKPLSVCVCSHLFVLFVIKPWLILIR